jgi:thioredoxin reductase (NADPH)
MGDGIQVYGTDWCGLTYAVRAYLTKSRIEYDYHNIEQDQRAEEFVLAMTDGRRRLPLVVVQERVLTNPTLDELQRVLHEHRLRPASVT